MESAGVASDGGGYQSEAAVAPSVEGLSLCTAAPGKSPNAHSEKATSTVAATDDLKQFLKVVRPDWSCPKHRGHNNIQRVIDKLHDIGVVDTWELIRRVGDNSINEDLSMAGHARFSRDTMEKIQKQSSFIRSLEHTKEPYYRQVGVFAPVPKLLGFTKSTKNSQKMKDHATDDPSEHPTGKKEEQQKNARVLRPATTDELNLGRPQTPRSGKLGAMGLGDHGGVFIAGKGATTSLNFADLLKGPSSHKTGALYLRNARPRHGRSKPSQGRPITVCSLPDLNKLQRGPGSLSSTDGWASSDPFPLRGRLESDLSLAASGSNSLSANSLSDDADLTSAQWDASATQQLKLWAKVGKRINNQPWVAKWSNQGKGNSGSSDVIRQGEAMLREQASLDDRRDLLRLIESEGNESPMRKHVGKKIHSQLLEHKNQHAQDVLDTQQRCMNIRNNLGLMQASRRDLSEHKRKAQDVLVGPLITSSQQHLQELGAELFKKAQVHLHEELSDDYKR